jgi:hypothetical protein
MNVYEVTTAFSSRDRQMVVANSMAEAEKLFNDKYWPTEILEIKLISSYVIVKGDNKDEIQKSI